MDNQTPREILSKFYSDNHLGDDGGNSSSSVKVEMNKYFYFYFPNFDARRKAVLLHDIHHLLTDYKTTITGESEISAWEIASGCKSYWVAFVIDTSGTMIGIPIHFLGVLRAYARGRRTKNLYDNSIPVEQALDMKIGELKRLTLLDTHQINIKPTFIDFLSFSGFAIFGFVYSILSLVLLPFIILYTIYTEIKIRTTKP